MLRVLVLVCALATIASAEPARDHAIYVDVLGKGGLWGAGYDWRATPHVAVGGVASFYSFDGDRFLTFAPYLAAYPVARGHHAAFAQIGPTFVRRTTPSPVPEWQGMTTSAIGGELSAGYEYRATVLIRVYAMMSAGDHVVPWLGASFGWTL